MTIAISLRNATLSYQSKQIFSNLNLDITAHRWSALLGESGIGKSSLLRFIAGFISHASGELYIQSPFAYMSQHDGLLPWASAIDNVLLPQKLKKQKKNYQKAEELLAMVGLKDALKLYPHQLSGGMRQRVALARTLFQDKPIVLMDEPFAALDMVTRFKLQSLAATLLQNKTVLFITHDPIEALRLSHEIYVMQNFKSMSLFVTLNSNAPRDLNHPDVIQWQGKLFDALTSHEHEII